jgi:hypothetical protein
MLKLARTMGFKAERSSRKSQECGAWFWYWTTASAKFDAPQAGVYATGAPCGNPLRKQECMAVNRNDEIVDPRLRVAVGLALMGLALEGLVGLWGYLGVLPLSQGPNDQRGAL